MFQEHALDILKRNNQKITKTRLRILDQLAEIKHPLNPYELIKQSTDSTIDITTIYRNLELFEKIGIVHKVQSLWWYLPCTHEHKECSKAHDIIICTSCNTINETHIDSSTKTLLWLSQWPVELNGRCNSCEQKN